MNIVSFSGGVDSTAMLFHMIELDYKIDKILFADTLLEFPEVYDHIENVEKRINIEIIKLKPEKTWDDWFYGKYTRGKHKGQMRGFPLLLYPCWWSREAKFIPLDKYCKGHNRHIGISYDEQKRITSNEGYIYPLYEWKWTKDNCIKFLKDIDMYPPIYKKFKRTGCWCCPKQSLDSLETLYNEYPKLWEKLKQYERDSPHGFRPNIDLKKCEINTITEENW